MIKCMYCLCAVYIGVSVCVCVFGIMVVLLLQFFHQTKYISMRVSIFWYF